MKQNLEHAQLARQRTSVLAASAAEHHQRVLTQIEAARDRNLA